MTGTIHFLTQFFNPFLQKIGYFNTNNFILKRILIATILVISSLISQAQSFNNIEFIENKGQWDNRVTYRANVSNGAVFLREGGFTILQYNPVDYANLQSLIHGQKPGGGLTGPNDQVTLRSHAYNVDFLGAAPAIKNLPDKPIPTYNNYYIGNDPTKWGSECHIYQAVTLKEVYPNIDVRYYTDNGFLKYDIIVKPGGDPSKIALKYDGIDKLEIKNKELAIKTSIGELKESAPYTYQATPEGKSEINCKYSVRNNIVRFDIKNYDPKATLIIDPVVIFCSFSGSSADNWGFTATYGPDGSMYGGGIVFGSGFPVSPGAFQTTFGGGGGTLGVDMSIIRLSPNGTQRIYATYVGGSGDEQPHSLVVDPQGNLVIAGRSNSGNYPVINNAGVSGSGFDIVVTKLRANGTGPLIGSRKIGGAAEDGVNISASRGLNSLQRNYGDDGRSEVILDAAGNVYVASSSQSLTFPTTPGCFQQFSGGQQDGVVLKFNPDLSTLLFSSFIGGSGNDAAYVLSLSPSGDIYVGGGTESTNFFGDHSGTVGTANHQVGAGSAIDGFVARINSTGTTLIKSAYIGTSAIDQVFGIQFDNNGFPYIMGQTTSGSWPIINAPYSNAGSKQFICKLQPDLSAYVYSTVFGNGSPTPNISPIAFLVDRCENVYISGWGGFYNSPDPFGSSGTGGLPITPDAIKSNTDGRDFYFFVLKKDAAGQLFGSFFGEQNSNRGGGDHVDGGTSRFDKDGVIYQAICGNCNIDPNGRPTFPTTPGAWSTVNNATGPGCNLTMVKIAMNLAGVNGGIQSAILGAPRDTSGCVPLTVDFSDTIAIAQSYEWYFDYVPGNPPSLVTNTPNAQWTFNTVGIHPVMLVAVDPTTCNLRDSSFLNIKAGDLKATLGFDPVKLPPCTQFNYRFDNTSVAPAALPFGPNTFIWDFGDNSPRITAGPASVFHTYANAGTYVVKLILPGDAYCNAPDSIEFPLSVASNVIASFTTPATGCHPYTAVFKNTSQAGQTWLWDFGDTHTSTAFEPTHLYDAPGTYTITLTATNPNTCNVTSTSPPFTITIYDSPIPQFDFSPVPPQENTPTVFTNQSSPDAVRFKWAFGDGDTLLTSSRSPVTHQYNATGTFNACLTAYNSIGCDSTICKPVNAIILPLVDVPNAFTPLSNDVNSIVYVRGFGIAKMTFTIWNRWGQKVFETNNRNQGWDGKFKGVVQPMDVYAYTLSIEFSDGKKTTKKGDLTLIR